MTTMKAMLIERYGKQQPLRLADVPVPAIGEHEILAEIHAAGAGLNQNFLPRLQMHQIVQSLISGEPHQRHRCGFFK